jgi:hypothetical protein
MLQGWVPPQWALFGAILAALRLGILSYWMNTYWCASIAALGGALVLGAWPRLRKRASPHNAVILAVGLVVLANSRPYEGFVFCIPVAFIMLAWLVGRDRPPTRQALARVVLPIFITLLAGGLATGFYYYRVTGSPFVLTYEVNRSQYATAPYFIWQTPRPEPEYHHAVMRDYYRSELSGFERNQTFSGYIERGAQKFTSWWRFYLGPLLTIPLILLPYIVRERKMAMPLLICAAMVAAFALQTWTFPHYFSPATGALYILIVQGLRHLRQWPGRRRTSGQALVRAIPLLACAMIVLRVTAAATQTHVEPDWPRGNLDRAAVLRQLCQMTGGQLVLVRYGAHHDLNREWVWNDASIDGSKVVWAHDMGDSRNQELLRYFPHRQAWLLEADDEHPKLAPYSTPREATRLLP